MVHSPFVFYDSRDREEFDPFCFGTLISASLFLEYGNLDDMIDTLVVL